MQDRKKRGKKRGWNTAHLFSNDINNFEQEDFASCKAEKLSSEATDYEDF